MSFYEIDLMLGNYVTQAHLLDMIHEHGLNFALTPDRRKKLKSEKASDDVLEAIAKSEKIVQVAGGRT